MREQRRKKKKKFTQRMQGTLLWCLIVVILIFFGLIIRMGYIHSEYGDKYSKKVLVQQTYVSNGIEYKRGDILDRNNTRLAISKLMYNVFLDPALILETEDGINSTAAAVAQYFEITEEEVRTKIENNPDSKYCVILKEQSKESVDAFNEMLTKEKARCKKEEEDLKIVGVNFEKKYKRVYPLNSVACNVVGFSSAQNSGLWGLENQYNEDLNGSSGRSYGYYTENETLKRTIKEAEDGHNIVTTLDVNIQTITEKKINKFMKSTGADQVAALVMNPKTGEIYAMASNVQYDLNNAFDLTQVYKESEVNKLSEEEKNELLNKMWSNICVSFGYEPGSTYKPLTVAAALEEGVATNNSSYVCDGGQDVSGTYIRCVSRYGHGAMNLKTSLMESCNDVMMQIVAKMGKSTFARYQNIFNIGRKTGIDLPGETSGLVYSEEKLGPTELATSSFGQSLTVNMVQIASAFSSVINGGNYYKPHLAKQIVDADGNVVENIEPVLVRKTVSEHTSDLLRQYLLATVEEGTGSTAALVGYSIGGKTGTAEKYPRGRGNYLVSFIGAAPMDDPEVVVYVIVDQPHVKDQAHSTYAQEVVHDIMKEILPFLGVYRDEKAVKKAKEEAALAAGIVPTTVPTLQPTEAPQETEEPTEKTEPTEEPSEGVSLEGVGANLYEEQPETETFGE